MRDNLNEHVCYCKDGRTNIIRLTKKAFAITESAWNIEFYAFLL